MPKARIAGTGRSDFPQPGHQHARLFGARGFPGIFRGGPDLRARTIPDEKTMAAAQARRSTPGEPE